MTRVEQNSPNADRRYENEKSNNTTAEWVDHYGKIMGEQPQDDHAVISWIGGKTRLEQEYGEYFIRENGKERDHLLWRGEKGKAVLSECNSWWCGGHRDGEPDRKGI